jgi:hypothetical protein
MRHRRLVNVGFRTLLALLFTASTATPATAQERVRCESHGYKYSWCAANVRGGRVFLIQEMSTGNLCREGYGWGTDSNGIWVDRGCRGDFGIQYGRRWNNYNNYDYGYDNSDSGSKSKNAAIAGAAVAAIIVGAMVAGSHSSSAALASVPAWAVGTFQGYNGTYGEDVTLTINPDGVVQGYTRSGEVRGSWVGGANQINVGGLILNVTQEASGLRTTQANNPSNIVSYRRLR